MQHEFRLDMMDEAGTMLATLTDFQWFSVVKQVNRAGMMQVGLKGRHDVLSLLQPNCQMEMWWRDPAETTIWSRLFTGKFEDEDWEGARSPRAVLAVFGPLKQFDYRVVNWYSGYASRSQFTAGPAETIMKTLVNYNAGAAALASNGRKCDGVISGGGGAADLGRGNVTDWACHGRILLETLQDLAEVAGGDFDLAKTGDASWEFEFYPGQLGGDLSADVTISKESSTLANAQYTVRRSRNRTAALVWGQNEGAARDYVTQTGNGWSADNHRELYVEATDIDDPALLPDRGKATLAENTDQKRLQVQIRQTKGCKFARDYDLGDLVGVINPYTGETAAAQVELAQVSKDQRGKQTIRVEAKL